MENVLLIVRKQFCFYQIILLFAGVSPGVLDAQMVNGQDTLFGNEWIDFGEEYIRMAIIEDGVYRISMKELTGAGFEPAMVEGINLRLFLRGEEVPIYVSTQGILDSTDWIEFPGFRNRVEMDRYLFENPDEQLFNPAYSMYTDTAVYFLSWKSGGLPPLRYLEGVNDFSDLPSVEAWCSVNKELVFSEQQHEKRYDSQHLIAYSDFDEGEGFGSFQKQQHELLFELDNWWKDDPAATVSLRLFSDRSQLANDHQLRVSVKGQSYFEATPAEYSIIQAEFEVSPDEVSKTLPILVEGLFDNTDRYAVSYSSVNYRRDFDFSDLTACQFELEGQGVKKYLEFQEENGSIIVYDLDGGFRLKPEVVGEKSRCTLLPFFGKRRYYYIDSLSGYKEVATISKITFRDLQFSDANYVIISPKGFLQKATSENYINAYADYRRSSAGGSYRVELVSVEEIFNQFTYGLFNHPQGLRNFAYYIRKNWQDVHFLFLVGHGYAYPQIRGEGVIDPEDHYIPCFGNPCSDNLMFSENGRVSPIFSVGRLAVHTNEEINFYLQKVKEHERGLRDGQTIEQQQWRQKVLHIVGGNTSEQAGFSVYLKSLEKEISENGYGGIVKTAVKESNEPIQTSVSQQVIDAVREGVGIKTFLGHGGVTNTDFGLDDPALFSNNGRYPVIFSLGCLSGNLFDAQNSLSERFVLAPASGSIAYIASSGFAYPNALEGFTRKFYSKLGGSFFGEGLGRIMKEVRDELESNMSLSYRSLLQQLSFHGDPAVRIRGVALPDLIPATNTVRFSPSQIDTRLDSFEVSLQIANVGYCTADSIDVQIKRVFGNTVLDNRLEKIKLTGAMTTFTCNLAVRGEKAFGANTFFCNVNSGGEVAEGPLPEASWNNSIRRSTGEEGVIFYIIDEQATPVMPEEFALINDSNPVLVGYSSKSEARKYRFELDTTPYFNSGVLRSVEKQISGTLLRWPQEVSLLSEKVYYWRVSPDASYFPDGKYNWRTSSFIYVPEAGKGWNQSHSGQLFSNEFDRIEWDTTTNRPVFSANSNSVIGESMALTAQNNALSRILFNNNRIFRAPVWWGKNLNIAVFDPLSGMNWKNPPGGTKGAYNLSGEELNAFVFRLDSPDERKKIIDFIRDKIPEGYYVLLFTNHISGNEFGADTWASDSISYGINLFSALELEGAEKVRTLTTSGTVPYIFAYVKGGEVLGEKLSSSEDEPVSLLFSLPGRWNSGSMKTAIIGPAQNWGRMEWIEATEGGATKDNIRIRVFGIGAGGNTEKELFETDKPEIYSLENISAEDYPWLKLEWHVADSVERSCPDFNSWRVIYQGFGDFALGWRQNEGTVIDTIDAGEELIFKTVIENIGSFGQDSTQVLFKILDAEETILTERSVWVKPLQSGESMHFSFDVDTRWIDGEGTFIMEVNPWQEQQEANYFNNVLVRDFYVKKDVLSPFLEVTFDGRRIMNGELISARPVIVINVRDENINFPLVDTGIIVARLEYPDGTFRQLKASDPDVQFVPANSGSGDQAQMIWEPYLSADGQYHLSVRGRDMSGNKSGTVDYSITFRVINKQSLSYIVPYPNPFSTQCRFAYTLTGEQSPTFFKLQIMTSSGKIVREIRKEEFGPLYIGTHLSDYIWDGTDMFGDKLANGVYLYRVIAGDDTGKEIERYSDNRLNQFFNKEIGKIVIIR